MTGRVLSSIPAGWTIRLSGGLSKSSVAQCNLYWKQIQVQSCVLEDTTYPAQAMTWHVITTYVYRGLNAEHWTVSTQPFTCIQPHVVEASPWLFPGPLAQALCPWRTRPTSRMQMRRPAAPAHVLGGEVTRGWTGRTAFPSTYVAEAMHAAVHDTAPPKRCPQSVSPLYCDQRSAQN